MPPEPTELYASETAQQESLTVLEDISFSNEAYVGFVVGASLAFYGFARWVKNSEKFKDKD